MAAKATIRKMVMIVSKRVVRKEIIKHTGRYQTTCLRRRHSTKNTNHEGASKT